MSDVYDMEPGKTYLIVLDYDLTKEPKAERPYYDRGAIGWYRGIFVGKDGSYWIFRDFKLRGDPSKGKQKRIKYLPGLKPEVSRYYTPKELIKEIDPQEHSAFTMMYTSRELEELDRLRDLEADKIIKASKGRKGGKRMTRRKQTRRKQTRRRN